MTREKDRRLRSEALPHRTTVRLDEDTYQDLELFTDAWRMSASELIRQGLRRLFGLASVFDGVPLPLELGRTTADSGGSPGAGGDGTKDER